MITILFYVAMCYTTPNTNVQTCEGTVPVSWAIPKGDEIGKRIAFAECAQLERAYMALQGYQESDCYIGKQK